MISFDFFEVVFWLALANGQVGILGEETEVSYGVYLTSAIASGIQLSLGEYVMDLEACKAT